MSSVHDQGFPYRPHILAAIVTGALLVTLVDPESHRGDKVTDTLAICLVAVFGYASMRLFVWLFVRPFASTWPRLLRVWGLSWFYGAIPLALFGLCAGTVQSHGPMPTISTFAFVIVAGASMSAGAFQAIGAPKGRLTNAWSGRET